MPKNNSKVRGLSKKESEEVVDVTCEKYLNKTMKINNLHALAKYLFWINNYYIEFVHKKWDGDMTNQHVQTVIDHLANYAKYFIDLGYNKYFSDFKITAYYWGDTISKDAGYSKGDFSGMVMRIMSSDSNPDDYFELSVATPYIRNFNRKNGYHKIAQYVKKPSKENSVSDVNLPNTDDLAYFFLPNQIASAVEDRIIEILKETDEVKCWVILQTGYKFE